MAMKFKGFLVKGVKPDHEMSDAEAEAVEKLIKEGYIIIYDKKGDYS